VIQNYQYEKLIIEGGRKMSWKKFLMLMVIGLILLNFGGILQAEEQPAVRKMGVKVYFLRVELVPVTRIITIPETKEVARVALLELLKGPTEEEKKLGLISLIPADTQLLSIEIDREQKAAFPEITNRLLNEEVGTELLKKNWPAISLANLQIGRTLQQFETVDGVAIICRKPNGETLLLGIAQVSEDE